MNRHLSTRQIDEWVIGERTAEMADHLQSCPACAGAVQRLAGPLTLFGSAARSWGEEQMSLPRQSVAANRWSRRLALLVATMFLLIAVPIYHHRQATRQAALTAARTAAQDEILLRHVQLEISQSVPAPMEPLAKLMPKDLTR